jgi:hypothetical protein
MLDIKLPYKFVFAACVEMDASWHLAVRYILHPLSLQLGACHMQRFTFLHATTASPVLYEKHDCSKTFEISPAMRELRAHQRCSDRKAVYSGDRRAWRWQERIAEQSTSRKTEAILSLSDLQFTCRTQQDVLLNLMSKN